MKVKYLVLLVWLLSSIMTACTSTTNTTIEGISIHYDTNREVNDNYVWQEYIQIRSDFPIAAQEHRIELISQPDSDTIPLYWFYNKPAQLELVNSNLYEVVFRTKKDFETLEDYYIGNAQKYASFQLVIHFKDTLLKITSKPNVKLDYVLNSDTLNWQTAQKRIKNIPYQEW